MAAKNVPGYFTFFRLAADFGNDNNKRKHKQKKMKGLYVHGMVQVLPSRENH